MPAEKDRLRPPADGFGATGSYSRVQHTPREPSYDGTAPESLGTPAEADALLAPRFYFHCDTMLRATISSRSPVSAIKISAAGICSCSVRIAAAKGGALAKFMKELGDVSGIQRTHSDIRNVRRLI